MKGLALLEPLFDLSRYLVIDQFLLPLLEQD